MDEPGATAGENDLKALTVSIDPALTGTVTLSAIAGATKIKLYENADRSTPVTLPKSWTVPTPELPKTFYVEGIAVSATAQDVEFKAMFTGNGGPCEDRVKLTVAKVTDINVHGSDAETWEVESVVPPAAFPLLHFVTARNQNDVVLQVTVVPDVAEVRDAINWSTTAPGIVLTSPAVGSDKRTVKFSSNAASGRKVPIEIKFGETSCRILVAWVVSADMTGTVGAPVVTPLFSGPLRDGTAVSAHIEPTATIHPAEIITDADRPNLAGSNVAPPLSGTNTCGAALADGVNARWDVSRQVRIATLTVPAGLPLDCQESNVSFPTDPVQGNDDAGTVDEDNNPYDASPAVGVLTSTDTPTEFGPNGGRLATGDVGNTFRKRVCFREFARLQLGPSGSAVWYKLSDYLEWRVDFRFLKRQVTEALWGLDTNGDGDLLDDVLESDLGLDLNGDGDMLDPVGYWDDDGTVSATDNADCG